ncbi:MAG: hypothetical protein AAGB31_08295 [Bdellovibrio sp.]
MTHFTHLIHLHTELQEFGLNPAQWSLRCIRDRTCLIQNKSDETFCLYGELEMKKSRLSWRCLKLESL